MLSKAEFDLKLLFEDLNNTYSAIGKLVVLGIEPSKELIEKAKALEKEFEQSRGDLNEY